MNADLEDLSPYLREKKMMKNEEYMANQDDPPKKKKKKVLPRPAGEDLYSDGKEYDEDDR